MNRGEFLSFSWQCRFQGFRVSEFQNNPHREAVIYYSPAATPWVDNGNQFERPERTIYFSYQLFILPLRGVN
jgi:hypothetical protein